MALEVRQVPPEVARQALINKVLAWAPVRDGVVSSKDPRTMQVLARDVPVPELLPYDYVYVDLYTDGRGEFFAAVDRQQARRRRAPRTIPGDPTAVEA